MRYTDSNQPDEITVQENTEEQLRREVEDLKRQLRDQKKAWSTALHPHCPLEALAPLRRHHLGLVFGRRGFDRRGVFCRLYSRCKKRNALIGSAALEQEQALPRVQVIEVGRSSAMSERCSFPAISRP